MSTSAVIIFAVCITFVSSFDPTVHPANPFNAVADAETLGAAFQLQYAGEVTIINLLTKRAIKQRLNITKAYNELYNRDLMADLHEKFHGELDYAIASLMSPVLDYYAKEIHYAVAGWGTTEDILIEILTILNNNEMKALATRYEQLYGRSLKSDVEDDTSGNFQVLLSMMINGERSEAAYNEQQCFADNKAIFEKREALMKTEKWVIVTYEKKYKDFGITVAEVLGTRSYNHLKVCFNKYRASYGEHFEDHVIGVFSKFWSKNLKKTLLAIAHVVHTKFGYLAKRLYDSMDPKNMNYRTLTRIIVSRSGVDLGGIKKEFELMYSTKLETMVAHWTSGNYQKFLLSLVQN
ncbi:annexin B9-like [Copidosoma floridanum]|uniref:annexin B9-like n=1 Tax=Copidosoma floridanum TaxID=29053 RepID=UPI0006C99ABB|nr:annexin B9-like [Copidosoma floridanum]